MIFEANKVYVHRGHFSERIIAFQYGAHPTCWQIWLVPYLIEYEMAGAFWRAIEDPEEVSIPGTWTDNDEAENEERIDKILEIYYNVRNERKEAGRRARESEMPKYQQYC